VEVGGYRLAWIGFAGQDEERRVRPGAQAGYEDGYLDTVDITWADIPSGRGPTGTAIRTGSPSVARNILTDPNYKPWRAEALKRGYNSSIALPLLDGEGCFGAINIYAMETDSFDEQEVNLLLDLAADLSYGLKVFRMSAAGKSAERQFWKTKALLLRVIDGISEPLVVLENLSVNMLNEAALKYYQLASYEQAIGKPCYEVFKGKHAPCEECYISPVMSEGEKFTLSRKGPFDPSRLEQVTVYPLKDRAGGVMGCILRISDITEQKDVERQLARADRLSSLGQLSGGIAHEIRNPLFGISLFVDILADEEEFERTDKELEVLDEIKDNIHKIDGIIKGVLSFARESDTVPTEIDLNSLIQENLKLWYARMRKVNIKLELSLDEDLSTILGDVIGIQQMVNNLVQNGVETMDGGGSLQISTQNGMSSFHENRPVVIMSVQDNGPGISQDLQERIFDPFFTTKSAGTGLGLSISHQIIERHGGIISCDSNPGQGTTFTVELPLIEDGDPISGDVFS
jgi:signal transduction histidine kinase/putative methionine-R-sulfoxide reductase with GAF domain